MYHDDINYLELEQNAVCCDMIIVLFCHFVGNKSLYVFANYFLLNMRGKTYPKDKNMCSNDVLCTEEWELSTYLSQVLGS